MPSVPIAVHAQDDALELYALGRLERAHASTIESHLLGCYTCRERLTRCIRLQLNVEPIAIAKPEDTHERSEPRFITGDNAVFQELSPLSVDRQKVKIVDVSRSGLGIVAPKAVLPGTIAQIRIKSSVEIGEVRFCSAFKAGGFRIGLRLHPVG
jgi:hypothetical protein